MNASAEPFAPTLYFRVHRLALFRRQDSPEEPAAHQLQRSAIMNENHPSIIADVSKGFVAAVKGTGFIVG